MIYGAFLFILCGMLIPPDVFPTRLRNLALALPFNGVIYAHARLFVSIDLARRLNVIVMPTVWIGVFGLALSTIFRVGMRHVSINGG